MRRKYLLLVKNIIYINIFIIVILVGTTVNLDNIFKAPKWNYSIKDITMTGFKINTNDGADLFSQVNVVLAGNYVTNNPAEVKNKIPENLMLANIQALAYSTNQVENTKTKYDSDEDEEVALLEITKKNKILPVNQEEPLNHDINGTVVLYCTHSAESYVPNSGKARLDGRRGLINNVAAELANQLSQRGIKAKFIDTIHDYEYQKSYINSRQTVESVLETEENIIALFDIHRDSIPGITSAATINIEGEKCSPILIIVGTDERKSHPNWHKNLQFAQELYIKGENMYPGLIKGVRTKAGTYNQEFHESALLLEFGTDYNSLSECLKSTKFFVNILVEVLYDRCI